MRGTCGCGGNIAWETLHVKFNPRKEGTPALLLLLVLCAVQGEASRDGRCPRALRVSWCGGIEQCGRGRSWNAETNKLRHIVRIADSHNSDQRIRRTPCLLPAFKCFLQFTNGDFNFDGLHRFGLESVRAF